MSLILSVCGCRFVLRFRRESKLKSEAAYNFTQIVRPVKSEAAYNFTQIVRPVGWVGLGGWGGAWCSMGKA